MPRPLRTSTTQLTQTPVPWVSLVLLALGTAFAFRGALHQYFAQDDFFGLAIVTGVIPRHQTLWRYASIQAFMDALYPVLRDRAGAYHAVCLGLHTANTVFLAWLLNRRFSGPAALIGAAWAGLHPSLFTA